MSLPPADTGAGSARTLPARRPLTGWRLWDDNPGEWDWTPRGARHHELAAWVAVPVPMCVQEALWRAGRIPAPYRDLNSRAAEWVEHRDWIYGCDFDLAPPPPGRRAFLEFGAVADRCAVYLNGRLLGRHEGPGAPFAVEIGPDLRSDGNQLLVHISAPWPEDPQIGRTDATHGLQGRMGYGWDFAPRLVRLGILGPVTLRETGPARLYDLWVRATPDADGAQATVDLAVSVDGPPDTAVDLAIRRGGRVLAHAEATAGPGRLAWARLTLPRPALWWPNGQGDQALYEATATCADGSDAVAATFGIRTLRWIARPGAPDDEWPLTLEVNGRSMFQRGWNWVPADSMGGPRADRRARRLLRLAQAAGTNMLRCWGGGDPETPAFYAACDRLGLLVWQEFPLSSAGISNTPPVDPAYLARVAAYAPTVIAARRNHPSLALWGGGNELTTPDGLPLTLDHPYAATLAAAVAAHDPDRAFRPSSPLGPVFDADPDKGPLWDVHGPWDYSQRQPGPQYWRVNAIAPALHSEFGLPGAAGLAGRPRYLSPRYQASGPDNPAVRHHGGAWWAHDPTLEAVFGPIADPAIAVAASQWLQAEGLRYYIEETRRRWPQSAGIFPWQLDEPWPNVVCTSAVEYGGRPKPAYYAVAGAYRPVVASARYPGLTLATGAPLAVETWLLSEAAAAPVEVTASLTDPAGRPLHEPATFAGAPGPAPQRLAALVWDLPPGYQGLAVLTLAWAGGSNRYVFSNAARPPLRALLDAPGLLKGMFAPEGE